MNAGTGQGNLRLKRIDHFEKRKSVKIRITGADSPDAMLTHEDGRVRIVQEIARQVRQFGKYLSCYLSVSLRRGKHIETW